MLRIFALIDQLATGLYIMLALLALWHLRQLNLVSHEYRSTSFELEKSLTRVQQVNVLTRLVILAQVALIILGIQLSALPFLQQQDEFASVPVAVADDGLFASRTPPPFVPSGLDGIEPVEPLNEIDSPVLQLSPTFTPTPVGTIIPGAPSSEGCEDERATLQIPANGMRVFQPITVIGTAFDTNFKEAKIEVKGPGLDTYEVVGNTLREARETSAFSQFSPGARTGLHEFRLMVFNLNNELVASCMVHIYIQPLPTATPPASDQ